MRLISKLALLALLITFAAAAFAADSPAKQPLRILYVGSSEKPVESKTPSISSMLADPERMPDFKQFLEKSFTSVTAIEAVQFTLDRAKDADVIIIDAKVPGGIPRDFTRPMIVMGGIGYFSIDGSGSKINWL